MQLNDTEFSRFLNNIIETKVKSIIKIFLQKFGIMKGWSATVVEVNVDETIDVQIAGDSTTTILNLKNKSGVSLSAGDEVELHSISSLSNAYVAICKTKDPTSGGGGEIYELPTASTTVKGGVKIGDNLIITSETLSVDTTSTIEASTKPITSAAVNSAILSNVEIEALINSVV